MNVGTMTIKNAEAVSRAETVGVTDAEPGTSAIADGTESDWDPEKLYAATLATCLHQALVRAAPTGALDTSDTAVRAWVDLIYDTAQDYHVEVRLSVSMPRVSRRSTGAGSRAPDIHHVCARSRS